MEAEISHPLLLRQLREHFGSDIPPAIDEFLLSVDRAYHESDAARERLGRSVSLSLEKLLAVSGGPHGGPVPNLQEEIRLATELLSQCMTDELEARVGGRSISRPVSPAPTVLCVVEAGLLRLIERILSPRGYRVLEAVTGADARDLMAAYSGRVDLLILDDNLPDIGWAPLYSDLGRRLAGGTLLLCNDSSRRAEPGGPIPLRKPFSIDELAEAVAEALAGTHLP